MHPVFAAQLNHILSLLNSGHSGHVFHLMLISITSPSPEFAGNIVLTYKMFQLDILQSFLRANTHYAQHPITSRKAETVIQITQILQQVTDQSLTSQTTRNHLKRASMKAVVKAKRPLLTKRHRKKRLDFALAHQDWTVLRVLICCHKTTLKSTSVGLQQDT